MTDGGLLGVRQRRTPCRDLRLFPQLGPLAPKPSMFRDLEVTKNLALTGQAKPRLLVVRKNRQTPLLCAGWL